jgi:heptosyltransferase-2
MTTPALLRLREALPEAHISLLTPEKLADLWLHHPAVDAVHAFGPEEGAWRVGRMLREEGFDLALVLPNSFRSALDAWVAGVPRRVGYGSQWRRWLLTGAVRPRPGAVKMRKRSSAEAVRLCAQASPPPSAPLPAAAHHICQYLHLVQALGASGEALAPMVAVTPAELERVAAKFSLRSGPEPLVGLNAGAEYGPAKRWPAERFVETALRVAQTGRCHWVVLGGPGDALLASQLTETLRHKLSASDPEARVTNLSAQTTLRELCAVLKFCRAVLTNDTGPMHVAAAVGTPVVVPFGSTSPELTGPGLPGDPRHHLLRHPPACAPCFLRECPVDFRCMGRITAEEAAAAVLRAIHAG